MRRCARTFADQDFDRCTNAAAEASMHCTRCFNEWTTSAFEPIGSTLFGWLRQVFRRAKPVHVSEYMRRRPKAETVSEINATLKALNAEECLVIFYIAERVRRGQMVYGELDLRQDMRDLKLEGADELSDHFVYEACERIKRGIIAAEKEMTE